MTLTKRRRKRRKGNERKWRATERRGMRNRQRKGIRGVRKGRRRTTWQALSIPDIWQTTAGAKAAAFCARKSCLVPSRQEHQSWFLASPKVASFEVWR